MLGFNEVFLGGRWLSVVDCFNRSIDCVDIDASILGQFGRNIKFLEGDLFLLKVSNHLRRRLIANLERLQVCNLARDPSFV